jgi:L-alanine-DL-glutamate epimerase-like enolase superfamily enzyme
MSGGVAKQKTPVASLADLAFAGVVDAAWRIVRLQLADRWAIARSLAAGGLGGAETCPVVVFELRDEEGRRGLGEASPSRRYGEHIDTVLEFLRRVEPRRLSPEDLEGSMAYLEGLASGNGAAKAAVNLALHDLAARRAGRALCDHLGLGFTEGRHVTSFSIGIDTPEAVRRKAAAAAAYPILKLKLGGPHDRENLAALREVALGKPIRVDANEGWRTKEQALREIEWLAGAAQPLEFVEQPMPAGLDPREQAWLRERSPVPLMADESYVTAADVSRCAEGFHAVNVKLIKTGGISGAITALRAARGAGLKTMIGCMIETSILISAAAHLAELSDCLDLDGNLLITNDPYAGVTAVGGRLSFSRAPDRVGLRVREAALSGGDPRPGSTN